VKLKKKATIIPGTLISNLKLKNDGKLKKKTTNNSRYFNFEFKSE